MSELATIEPSCVEQADQAEARMLKLPQVNCPVTHLFAKGIYWREVFLPKGVVAIGHRHKLEHLNVLLSGRVRVLIGRSVEEIAAPAVFRTEAGARKIVFAVEAARWANVHANPTDEADLDKLEVLCVEKSLAWRAHHQELDELIAGKEQS